MCERLFLFRQQSECEIRKSASQQLLKGVEQKLQVDRLSGLKLCLQSDDRDERKRGSVKNMRLTIKDLIV